MQMTEFNHNYITLGLNFIGNTATRKTQCKNAENNSEKVNEQRRKTLRYFTFACGRSMLGGWYMA